MKRKSSIKRKTAKAKKTLKKGLSKWIPHLLIVLIILMILQFFGNTKLALTLNTVAGNNAQAIDEIGQVIGIINEFGTDLNEVRQFLLLPTKNYTASFLAEVEEEELEEGQSLNDPIVQIFEVIEEIGSSEVDSAHYEKASTDLDAYLNAVENVYYFETKGLYLRNGVDHHLADGEGMVFVTVSLADNGDLTLETYGQDTRVFDEDSTFEDFKTALENYLNNELSAAKSRVAELKSLRENVYNLLVAHEEIQAALSESNLEIGEEREIENSSEENQHAYDFLSEDGVVLATLTIGEISGVIEIPQIEFSSEEYNEDEFASAVLETIGSLDGRSYLEKSIESLQDSIESLREDPGFLATLEKYELTFTFDPIETDTAYEYPLMNSEGEIIRILYISKETGELMIKEPDAETGSLLSYMLDADGAVFDVPDVVNVREGIYDTDDEINILVAGKHGMNVDTMIFANIDVANQKVTLVSIPRDLFYNGRKINSVYAYYGMDELARQLSDITGRKIEQYILVDMYVFIDLIDLVGGIDVTLEEDLIDPTYKTYDNGTAGTLYYAAGTHHFTGVQALRVARSRHTSSDFSRAARQQIILNALQDKAQNLGFGDATTVIQLIETVLDQTDTNISIEEGMLYYFRYQNFELARGNVLTSGNVLQSVPVPVNTVTSMRIDDCSDEGVASGECAPQYAMYTLSPKNNNWDYVRWYFDELLED